MSDAYPVGTRVKSNRYTNKDGSVVYGRVVEKGPSIYGTVNLQPGQIFVAIEKEATNNAGATTPAGTIFACVPAAWDRVEDEPQVT